MVGLVALPGPADVVSAATETARAKAPSLKVTITGLPGGTKAGVTVKGPNRYKRPLTGSATLKGLAPGTYKVIAKSVSLASGTARPVSPKQSVEVNGGKVTVTVRYTRPTSSPPAPPPPTPPTGGPQITTTSLPSGMVEVTYNERLERTPGGVPFSTGSWSWVVAQAPPGLAIDGPNGTVFGTPTVPGTYAFTVTFTGGGHSDSENVTLTVAPKPPAATWKLVSAGIADRCGIKSDDTAWCWGLGQFGSLGNGSDDDSFFPVKVAGTGTWKTLDVGGFTCGLKMDDTAWCWGYNQNGELGDGSTTNRSVPVQVSGGGTWTAIDAGNSKTCGIKTDGTAWCWGAGYLGDGETVEPGSLVPVLVQGGDDWSSISVGVAGGQAGGDHTCAIKTDGSAWCWGEGFYGALGTGTADYAYVPTEVDSSESWTSIVAGSRHTCGISDDEALWCWGSNNRGQLGTGVTGTGEVAEAGPWSSVGPGDLHTCGVKEDSTGWCWGENGFLNLGDATTGDNSTVPLQISGSWDLLDAGDFATCGIKTDGKAFCWGTSFNGGLGDGSSTESATPVPVLG
jgi:alpha-tubulin suppressor-like RCC1 family protein